MGFSRGPSFFWSIWGQIMYITVRPWS
jgi:hypothetical protein